ncbi:MAG TPA: ATP-binding protein [Burkholderiales bacterium]|nr:ATP-binding protein [Burkholderiales bacterium]
MITQADEPVIRLQRQIVGAHPQWWLGGMLLALHCALAWGIDQWWARGMLLAHFGLFLMWQPVWRGERSLESRHALLVIIVGVLLAGWNNWWLMAVWIAVLFALIGGNLLGSRQPRQRFAALLAALYLLSMLLIWVIPHTFEGQQFEPALIVLVRYGLLALPVIVIMVPVPAGSKSSPLAIDLFYSLSLFLLVAGLVLGSFVVKQVSHGDYALALAQSLFVMALLLMTLSWLWNPHSGFTGIGYQLSRYLMSLGLPFERWVKGIADLAEREREPARFLTSALHDMRELPWIAGVAWQSPHGGGEVGVRSRFRTECSFRQLTLTFYTRWSLSPALLLHLNLLTQMLGHFYEAKRREEMQRQNAYTQAIYETGARLTHDVKNLLQSLKSLCAAAESSGAGQAAELQQLVRRQLPQIAQRLSVTLEKLKAPQQEDTAIEADAAGWWSALQQRYARNEVRFSLEEPISTDSTVPGELFDGVAENLLQNALAKARQHPDMRISVVFRSANGGRLTICDSGPALPRGIAADLFTAPVPSRNGLGIGLYQAAKQAEQSGYKLTLTSNDNGSVCFELSEAGIRN